MLVLSRKPNEAIKIGEGIIIQVIDIRGDKVRLGVTAPKDLSIVRDDAIRTEPAPPACVLPRRGGA